MHTTLVPGSAGALAVEFANASAAAETRGEPEPQAEPRASTSGARRPVVRLTDVRKSDGESAASSGAYLRVALADAADSARPGPQARPQQADPQPAVRAEPRPVVSDQALRSAALQQSALTAPPAALSQVTGTTDSIVAELPPRRSGWLVGGVIGLLAAAGIAALVISSPSFSGRSDPAPSKQPVAVTTPEPVKKLADATPRPLPVDDVKPEPPRGEGLVPPPVEPPPEVPDEPQPTAVPTPADPGTAEPDPGPKTRPDKKDTKKKPRRREVPEEEPEKDVFDQLREHMAKKKADEEARKANLERSNTPAPTPTPTPTPARTGPQTDAERARETLDRARTAASSGNPQLGYTLAKQSHGLSKSQEALELMGSCACRLKNENNARSALDALSGSRRDTVIAACTKVGINL